MLIHYRESALRFSVQDKTHILMEAGGDLRLLAFGTHAETKYMELTPKEHTKVHYLKHFKAQVRDKEVLLYCYMCGGGGGQWGINSGIIFVDIIF